jgi:hypothetical protein
VQAETLLDFLLESVTENPNTKLVREKALKLIQEIREAGNHELADALFKCMKPRMTHPDFGTYKNYWNYLAKNMLPDLATGGGKDMHEQQYIFLVHECGLEKNDLFLDIGTGSLRGSKKVITYLEKNHFYGMDISEELISFAKNRVSKNLDLMQKEPYLEIDDRFRFSRAFPGKCFNFCFAKSVFTHIYPDAVWDCLVQLRKVVHNSGKFYATIFKDNNVKVYHGDVQKMYYNTEWLAETADLAGWSFEEIGDTRVGQYMCLFKPIPVQYC